MNTEENIKRFEELTLSVQREGMDKLLNYVRKSDFYRAPSSTKFHLSCEGGLLQHSLNVYDCLQAKKQNPTWAEILSGVKEENLIIMSLFHDLCKANYYVRGTRNQKTYDKEKVAAAEDWQKKHDSQGDFIWETVETYTVNDQMPLGHGEKSAMILQQFIRLDMVEAAAVRWHMGPFSGEQDWNTLGLAMEKYPVVLALFEADMEASKILEKEN